MTALLSISLTALLAAGPMRADKPEPKDPDKTTAGPMASEDDATPKNVLERLAVADKGEIKMGELAQQNGERTKSYGAMLQKDHSTSLKQVQDMAGQKGADVSGEPTDPVAKHEQKEGKESYDKLAKLHGAEFDRAFASAMVEDHQKDIDHVKTWRTHLHDQQVSSLLDQTLPVLQHHLDMAKTLRAPAAQGRSPR